MGNLANEECNSFVAIVDNHRSPGSTMPPSSVLPILDPCTGDKRQYLGQKAVKKNTELRHIYEVQSLPHARSSRSTYGSFFIDSHVVSNPNLHLVTPMDPLYLLLPYFEAGDKWQPWNQIAHSKNIPSEILQAINTDQLRHLFKVNDSLGDDMILYKFEKEKALKWLNKKMQKVQNFLAGQFLSNEKNEKNHEIKNVGAFSSSFHLSESSEQNDSVIIPNKQNDIASNGVRDLAPSEKEMVHRSAAQVICEYLSDQWKGHFLTNRGLAPRSLSEKKQKSNTTESPTTDRKTNLEVVTPTSTSSKRPYQSGSIMSEADKLMQYTMGTNEADTQEKSSKKMKEMPKSVGLKRLSKVNTKGALYYFMREVSYVY